MSAIDRLPQNPSPAERKFGKNGNLKRNTDSLEILRDETFETGTDGMNKFWWGTAILVVAATAIVWSSSQDWITAEREPAAIQRITPGLDSLVDRPKERIPEGHEVVGGVVRPESDVKQITKPPFHRSTRRLDPGVVPKVKENTNAYTKSVAEAIRNPKLAHRLTSLIPAPEFDVRKYEADPKGYLSTVEPGRIRQYLQPGLDTVPIQRVGAYFRRVLQGETVVLEARARAGMPVTFYSGKLGQFQNQLSTITVAANEDGIAKADFKVSGGTR